MIGIEGRLPVPRVIRVFRRRVAFLAAPIQPIPIRRSAQRAPAPLVDIRCPSPTMPYRVYQNLRLIFPEPTHVILDVSFHGCRHNSAVFIFRHHGSIVP